MELAPLQELARGTEVENVLIYVSDALRYDHIPDCIAEQGVTAKAIAPSTFTASSLPSIFTGQYPATHRVWLFQDQLREKPTLFREDGQYDVGFDAETVWLMENTADKPPLRIHHLEEERGLEELTPPFVHAIHDVGPHAPYGFDNTVWESTKDFFRDNSDAEALRELYAQDCINSAERFLPKLDYLEENDLLDDTLVVYTSDHGQCLGETHVGGQFGHGFPMVPEVLEIPLTFIGAGLPTGERFERLLSSVDIVPTLLSAQGRSIPREVAGVDIWTSVPDPARKIRSDVWAHKNIGPYPGRNVRLNAYAASSVWDESGGRVQQRSSRLQRLGYVLLNSIRGTPSPAWRANWTVDTQLAQLKIHLSKRLTFGDPDFDWDSVDAFWPPTFEESTEAVRDLEDEQELEEKLEELGYLS